ncbi:hypothetical protein BCR35DRAFT_310386 [Leucosporidium creatinivorum]|uniref:Phospholipid/glycerol acyltransferase domain-containing protein n=1 Tax=Leucosporidium creatinivorum TaxID=106004 RepID=A0A1Y2D534_9BASI|nr:hypothetical protein BCR35DRAFT_310386 [Leucosporidium creatinivorum]
MPFGPTHSSLRSLAQYATQSFFSRIHIDGEEHVPQEGPVIALANHHNSAVDPAMLSCFFPHNRKLHYWAKSTLFKPGLARTILLDAGNIPVDRRTKDNQKLFASTFDMLKHGECIAVFPEGGSYTMPGLLPTLKDGASWAALEYSVNIRGARAAGEPEEVSEGSAKGKGRELSSGGEVKEEPKDVTICVAGINFTDKTKYRSSAIMQFGPSISVTPYVDEFYIDPKSAVKKLTKAITEALIKLTINAGDWDSLKAATMARKMLWVDERTIPLAHFRDIGQSLVDLFSPSSAPSPEKASLQHLLLAYSASLEQTGLTHSALAAGVPLPPTLDPAVPHPLPTRAKVLGSLMWSTARSLGTLPFFIVPLLVHLPIYLVGKWSLRLSALEEDKAQNKIAISLILALFTYFALFLTAWALLFLTPLGAVGAFAIVWLFAVYHNTLIDDNYNKFKTLRASWLVLLGIWAPHAKSEAVSAINRRHDELRNSAGEVVDKISLALGRQGSEDLDGGEKEEKVRRELIALEEQEGENAIRKVLRLRGEASKALGEFFNAEGQKELRGKLVGWGAKIPSATGLKAGKKEQ